MAPGDGRAVQLEQILRTTITIDTALSGDTVAAPNTGKYCSMGCDPGVDAKENAPARCQSSRAGHRMGKLPCTRKCYFETSKLPRHGASASCVMHPETLLHVAKRQTHHYTWKQRLALRQDWQRPRSTSWDRTARGSRARPFHLPQAPRRPGDGVHRRRVRDGIINGISALLQRRSRDG